MFSFFSGEPGVPVPSPAEKPAPVASEKPVVFQVGEVSVSAKDLSDPSTAASASEAILRENEQRLADAFSKAIRSGEPDGISASALHERMSNRPEVDEPLPESAVLEELDPASADALLGLGVIRANHDSVRPEELSAVSPETVGDPSQRRGFLEMVRSLMPGGAARAEADGGDQGVLRDLFAEHPTLKKGVAAWLLVAGLPLAAMPKEAEAGWFSDIAVQAARDGVNQVNERMREKRYREEQQRAERERQMQQARQESEQVKDRYFSNLKQVKDQFQSQRTNRYNQYAAQKRSILMQSDERGASKKELLELLSVEYQTNELLSADEAWARVGGFEEYYKMTGTSGVAYRSEENGKFLGLLQDIAAKARDVLNSSGVPIPPTMIPETAKADDVSAPSPRADSSRPAAQRSKSGAESGGTTDYSLIGR